MSVDKSVGIVTVPGSRVKTITAAGEDVRLAVTGDEHSQAVIELIDELQELMDVEKDNSEDELNLKTNIEENEDSIGIHSDEPALVPQSGDRLDIYWTLDNKFYPATVSRVVDNQHTIQYDDGDEERLNLESEEWRWNDSANNITEAHATLPRNSQETLNSLLETFGSKDFMRHQAQEFEQSELVNDIKHKKRNSPSGCAKFWLKKFPKMQTLFEVTRYIK